MRKLYFGWNVTDGGSWPLAIVVEKQPDHSLKIVEVLDDIRLAPTSPEDIVRLITTLYGDKSGG